LEIIDMRKKVKTRVNESHETIPSRFYPEQKTKRTPSPNHSKFEISYFNKKN